MKSLDSLGLQVGNLIHIISNINNCVIPFDLTRVSSPRLFYENPENIQKIV